MIGKRKPFPIDALKSKTTAKNLNDAKIDKTGLFRRRMAVDADLRPRPLPLNSEFLGPVILEQLDATTVIHPGDRAQVDVG